MSKPEDLPADLPEEVKAVLSQLKPEPEALVRRRERLLAELDNQIKSSTGLLQQLLGKLQGLLQSMQPQAPFNSRIAEEFSQVLAAYVADPATPKPPPPLVGECMTYLRERAEAMGMGQLLASAGVSSAQTAAAATKADAFNSQSRPAVALNPAGSPSPAPAPAPRAEEPKQKQDLQTLIKLGNTRG
jgi:hypothetical protein